MVEREIGPNRQTRGAQQGRALVKAEFYCGREIGPKSRSPEFLRQSGVSHSKLVREARVVLGAVGESRPLNENRNINKSNCYG